jgi:outer membrane murein-binding lipoprotein Lpp
VLIRAILAIPLAVVLLAYGIAAFFIIIIGWFGALFTGQLPEFARRFITRLLKLTANFSAYVYLLTDIFPPFEADGPGYPVQLAVPTATKLNRAAVFFRIILLIPAQLVGTAVQYGMAILMFFLWIITLCTGQLPLSAHNALRAVVRFQLRLGAYIYLVVPTYPGGLFGDGMAPPAVAAQVVAEPTVATEPLAPAPAPSDPWKLLLNRGARRLLVVAIVLGALGYVGQITLQAALGSRATNQISTLNSSVESLDSSFTHYEQNVQGCQTSSSRVACVEAAAATLSGQLQIFANRIDGLNVDELPSGSINAAVVSARSSAEIFDHLANAGPTVADYEMVANRSALQSHLDQLQSDLNNI